MKFWGQVSAVVISAVFGAAAMGGFRYMKKDALAERIGKSAVEADDQYIISTNIAGASWASPMLIEQSLQLASLPSLIAPSIPTTTSPYRQSIDEYLCEVYKRTPVKKDAAGDFTWKDPAAAKRQGMDVCSYAVGGMAPELRERLAAFGKVADARGINWSILSGFRDDWRQSIAEGIKAGNKTSKHGGSVATGGYGDGRAADIVAFPIGPLMALVDQMGPDLGLIRPYRGFDPYHVQLAGPTRMAAAKPAKVRYAKRHRKHSHRRA